MNRGEVLEPSSPRALRGGVRMSVAVRAVAVLLAMAAAAWTFPPAASAEARTGGFALHVVRPGDSLFDIALRYGTTVEAITTMGRLANPDWIFPGMVLVVPQPVSDVEIYRVQPGDTLSEIAWSRGVDLARLIELNGLTGGDHIVAGSELRLPRSGSGIPRVQPAVAAPVLHLVRPGDTLWALARQYGVSETRLAEANGLRPTDHLLIGQQLAVPGQPPLSPPAGLAGVFVAAADGFGLDVDLLLALSYIESGWQMDVVSPAGAVGVMQVMPETAVWAVDFFGLGATNWRTSVFDNVQIGAAYLDHLLFLSGGDERTALAAYYQGWTSLHRDGPFADTRQYVADVLALRDRFRFGR